jgi:hypothetical protein
MARARDSLWGHHRLPLRCFAAKLSHVGVDVDGLACHLLRSYELWLIG